MSHLLALRTGVNSAGFSDPATIGGLSEEVQYRLKQEGYNELPSSRKRSLPSIDLSVVREPMFFLLLAGCAIYLILGDIREALVLPGSILVIMVITLYQEQKTGCALAALRDLSSPRALVIRDGQEQRTAGRDVVRGDIAVPDEPTTRTMASTTLVLANPGLIFANRSHSRSLLVTLRTRNAALWWVVGGTLLLLILALSIPTVRDLFAFSQPSPTELPGSLTAGAASLLWSEAVKIVTRRYVRHG